MHTPDRLTCRGRVRALTAACVAVVLTSCSAPTDPGASGPASAPTPSATAADPTGTARAATSATGSPQASATAPTVGTLMTQALANARAAKSVRVIGRLLIGGRSSAVQAEGQPGGANQRMILSGRQWGTFEARAVGGVWYLKGDRAFYVASKNPNVATLAGKWVRMTAAQAASMRGSTVGGLLNVLLNNKDLAALTEAQLPAQVITYEGRGAYSIGRQLTSDGSEIIVSGTAPIRFLELRSGPKENVRLLFGLWNAVPPIPAPPANLIVAG